MADNKRRDSNGVVLQKGETESSRGYRFEYVDPETGKKRSIYSKSLYQLRKREKKIEQKQEEYLESIRTKVGVTLRDVYLDWLDEKQYDVTLGALRQTTLSGYKYMLDSYIPESWWKSDVSKYKYTNITTLYRNIMLRNDCTVNTVANVHTPLHQIFQTAVHRGYINSNPSDNAMYEIKRRSPKKNKDTKALTREQQEAFLNYVANSDYKRWYNLFAVGFNTGLRIGELTGLIWSDVDFNNRILKVRRTLVYRSSIESKKGGKMAYGINDTKTPAGFRDIALNDTALEALKNEKQHQIKKHIKCESTVDGLTGFIFLNRYNEVLNNSVVNRVIKRVIRDYNNDAMVRAEKEGKDFEILPNFSSHSMRHSFATRMAESGISEDICMKMLGHSTIMMTKDIYTHIDNKVMVEAITSKM